MDRQTSLKIENSSSGTVAKPLQHLKVKQSLSLNFSTRRLQRSSSTIITSDTAAATLLGAQNKSLMCEWELG